VTFSFTMGHLGVLLFSFSLHGIHHLVNREFYVCATKWRSEVKYYIPLVLGGSTLFCAERWRGKFTCFVLLLLCFYVPMKVY